MGITLDDRDGAVLERLREGDADVEALATSVDCNVDELRGRLPELADEGLVRAVGDDEYAVTADGKRAIAASPAGTMDDRIDTPPAVEDRIESFDLRPDRADAVRGAFAFLYFWGDATAGEIVDGVYSEHPAGFESEREWWNRLVRDRLADLPSVEPAESDGEPWRYAGATDVEDDAIDGRVAPDDPTPKETSVRFALERLDDERAPVRVAFDYLVREGEANTAELQEAVYPDYGAGYESTSAWWTDCVRPAFERLPGVEGSDGDGWRYRQDANGSPASAPEADPSQPSEKQEDGNGE